PTYFPVASGEPKPLVVTVMPQMTEPRLLMASTVGPASAAQVAPSTAANMAAAPPRNPFLLLASLILVSPSLHFVDLGRLSCPFRLRRQSCTVVRSQRRDVGEAAPVR